MTSYPQWSNRVLVLGLLLQIRFPFLHRWCRSWQLEGGGMDLPAE